MRSIRVLHFGLGPIGASIVKQIAARPGLKIVGAVDVDPAKVGRDLGDVAGLSKRLNIRVQGDAFTAPLPPKESEDARSRRARNRRVEIIVTNELISE